MDTIGVANTAVRRVLDEAARLVQSLKPITLLALVLKGEALHGLFVGDIFAVWAEAVALSAQLNSRYSPHPFHTILSMPSTKYEDLWTAAKAMYKTEPVAAAGGEVIIYAPHLKEISYSHGPHIREVGYHVRDYFVKQWDKFSHLPGGVLAHSTHVKGQGTFEAGREQPRVQVTLATGIPEADCRHINLGYRDPATIDPASYAGREAEGILLVENAGEYLYRLKPG
jgi:nickel-dependent lactate racemase